jgi:hypothetical protein
MWEEILKMVTLVYLPSMLKFIFGPLAGYAAGLNIVTTVIGTSAGMMTIVILITYSGNWFRKHVLNRFSRKKKNPNPQPGKFTLIIKKFGVPGIAFFTPLLLTPIGGSILAVGMGGSREKILLYMLLSAVFWAIIFSSVIYFFGQRVIPEMIK